MKVYVITRGSYSDYKICAVSLDKNNYDIYADDKESAIKIAADRRAEYIARKQGI